MYTDCPINTTCAVFLSFTCSFSTCTAGKWTMITNADIQNEHLHLTAANSKRLPAQEGIIANFRTQKCLLPQKFLLTSGLLHYQTVGSQLEQVMSCCCPKYPHSCALKLFQLGKKTEVNLPSSVCLPRK